MKPINRKSHLNGSFLFSAAFALYLFYYSYRYIFRYNSETTSPTYSDTPLPLSIAKYILLLYIITLLFLCVFRLKFSPKPILTFAVLLLLICQEIYAFFYTKDVRCIIPVLCILPVVLLLLVQKQIDINPIEKICTVYMHFAIIYEFLQIILYIVFGRLPALGYDLGSLTDVRFGGPIDDPNGFSVLLAFFIPYAVYKYKGKKRIFYTSILSVFIILTWSLTGIFAFFCALLTWALIRLCHAKSITIEKVLFTIFCIFAGIVFLIFFYNIFYDKISYFIETKLGSIAGHLAGFDISFSLETWIGFSPVEVEAESSVIMLIGRGGIFHLIVFYVLMILSVIFAYRNLAHSSKNDIRYPFLVGIFFYQVAFLIASFNLPLIYAFCNFGVSTIFLYVSIQQDAVSHASVKSSVPKALSVKS